MPRIRSCIDAYSPTCHEPRGETRRAAVAVVLRWVGRNAGGGFYKDTRGRFCKDTPGGSYGTEALFILRATKEGDPWSGQMAFPGGHHEAGDASLRHTAERETREEIGLDLSHVGNYIGQLDPVQANPRGHDLDLVVTPFVYELKVPVAEFSPNYEVADVRWGSLNEMHAGVSHTREKFILQGETHEYPGYGVGDRVVWGLTYRMLDQFFTLLDPAWVPRD